LSKIPGRPAYPRSASLAPRHTLPRLRSRSKVTSSSAFESRIGRRFDRMDRKACTRIKGTTIQRKAMSMSAINLHGRSQASTCNVGATEGRGEPEGGRPASHRPAGLALAAFQLRKLHRLKEAIRDVHAKAVARWPHPQAGKPRGGQPAPPCSHSSLGFAWKLSTTVTTASNRRHVLHLLRTDLGRAINRALILHL